LPGHAPHYNGLGDFNFWDAGRLNALPPFSGSEKRTRFGDSQKLLTVWSTKLYILPAQTITGSASRYD
jgi:hypothetical protein